MPDSNLDRLTATARILGPLADELVFVGGAVTALLISDEGAGGERPTLDVDAIADADSYRAYAALGLQLRSLGFLEDQREGAPLCRWVHGDLTLDVMPLDAGILGFSNRWYRLAMDSAISHTIAPGVAIRVASAPYFLATKFEAFLGRGHEYLADKDLEDIVSVLDGRPEVVSEVRRAPPELRAFIALRAEALLEASDFLNALPGYLLPDAASQRRIIGVLERLRALAEQEREVPAN